MSHQNTQSMGGGGGVGMNGGKRMEGIGNPMFKDARSDDQQAIGDMTVGDMVSAAKTGFAGMIRDPLARSAAGGGNSSDRHRIGVSFCFVLCVIYFKGCLFYLCLGMTRIL